ncbi:MAG TPA: hypothetical protein VKZ49_03000 [Polyangiaceae bacterium]|nr:hypothetical protein [Polyangiaceae bacterium]
MRRSVQSLAACMAAALLVAGCPLAVSDEYQVTAADNPEAGTIATPEQAAPGGKDPSPPNRSDAAPGKPAPEPDATKAPPDRGADRKQAACESVCSAGCSGDVCSIDCSAQEHCERAKLDCPPGRRCTIVCGTGSCKEATIRCPDSECDIQCSGDKACAEAHIRCGEKPCTVTCVGDDACEDATLDCDPGSCTTSGAVAECDDDACDD